MNNNDIDFNEVWSKMVQTSKAKAKKDKRRMRWSSFWMWLKEHAVELLALIVSVVALIRTF